MAVNTKGSLVVAAFATFGASACCAGPLILLLLGISGAWVARLVALEPYSAYFTGLALLFMSTAFYNLYVRPRHCALGDACAAARVRGNQRFVFWLIAVPMILLLTFPWFAPLFY